METIHVKSRTDPDSGSLNNCHRSVLNTLPVLRFDSGLANNGLLVIPPESCVPLAVPPLATYTPAGCMRGSSVSRQSLSCGTVSCMARIV